MKLIKTTVVALSVTPFFVGAAFAEGCFYSQSVKAPTQTTVAEAEANQTPAPTAPEIIELEDLEGDLAKAPIETPVSGS